MYVSKMNSSNIMNKLPFFFNLIFVIAFLIHISIIGKKTIHGQTLGTFLKV